MAKRTSEYGETGGFSLANHEDVPYEVKDTMLFMRVKKSTELKDPTRPEVEQGFLVGPWYAPFDAPFEMGSWHITQLVGKNVAPASDGNKTAPAGRQSAAPKIRFVKDYQNLDTEFKAFEDYAEHSKFACNSGRPLGQGENGIALSGTGGLKEYQRMWTDLGTLVADQESGKYSPAVFAMNGNALDERLNAGLQTFWNVKKDALNNACLCWNMREGSGYGSGKGLMWWKGDDVISICNYIDFGPFRFGLKGLKADKHWQKRNEDDEDIVSLHFDPNKTYWYINQRWDAPSLHEGETTDRGSSGDEIKKVQWMYYHDSTHPSPRDNAGRMIWISFDKIKKGTPPPSTPTPGKTPPGIPVEPSEPGVYYPVPRDLDENIDIIDPFNDYFGNPKQRGGKTFPATPGFALPYISPINTANKNKFQSRSSSQNISFPCVQLVGQIPNKYSGEEGFDWDSEAKRKMNDKPFMQYMYMLNPSLEGESESETINYIADFMNLHYAQSAKNSRPNIACIDGIGKVTTVQNKSRFDYTHRPTSLDAAYEQGTASGMVLISPPERSNHWDSGALALSTLDWAYYKTVQMGWIDEATNTATMTDVKSTFFIPDEVAGELNLDLWFYTTGAARSGVFTVHGTIVATGQIDLPDGTIAVPALKFSSNLGNGIYRVGADVLGFSQSTSIPADHYAYFGTPAAPEAYWMWDSGNTRFQVSASEVYYSETVSTAVNSYPWNIRTTKNVVAGDANLIYNIYNLLTTEGANNYTSVHAANFNGLYNYNTATVATAYAGYNMVRNLGVGTITTAFGGYVDVRNDSTGRIVSATGGQFRVLNNVAGLIDAGTGGVFFAQNISTGTMPSAKGGQFYVDNRPRAAGMTVGTAGHFQVKQNHATGSITTSHGILIESPANLNAVGLPTYYGLRINSANGGANAPMTGYNLYIEDDTITNYLGGSYNIIRQLDVEGYSAFGNGSALDADWTMIIDRDFTGTDTVSGGFKLEGVVTGAEDADIYHGYIKPSGSLFDTAIAGNANIVASFVIDEPVLTVADVAPLIATNLLLRAAPTEGTNNFSLDCVGNAWFEADVEVGKDFRITLTDAQIDAGGAVTKDSSNMRIESAGGAGDNLDTINGGVAEDILILQCENSAETITVRDNAVSGGNIYLAGAAACALAHVYDKLVLKCQTDGVWTELSRSITGL